MPHPIVLRKSPERAERCLATCPCLAKTKRILHLISRSRGAGQAGIPKWSNILAGCPVRTQARREGDRQGPGGEPPGPGDHLRILATTPAPTVRPPSRIAKRRPSSIATGLISDTFIFTLSPGITISVPSGSSTDPVMSVVRK